MNKLRLSDWASIAEVIGAMAVVISLIYVGFQIKANTIEVRATNRQELVSRSLIATHTAASSPELAGALAKAAEGAPLTPVELAQYRYFVRGMQYDIQEAYLLYHEGLLDEAYWLTRASKFRAYMQSSNGREVYKRHKTLGVLHADFVRWADQVLDEN
jgi:hypothetical protein